MGLIGTSPHMYTVHDVGKYQWVVKRHQSSCIKNFPNFGYYPNTFWNFVWNVSQVRWPFQSVIDDHSKEFGFINLHYTLAINNNVFGGFTSTFRRKKACNSSYLYSMKVCLTEPMHRHWPILCWFLQLMSWHSDLCRIGLCHQQIIWA